MYGFSIKVNGSVEQITQRVTEELKKEGFGVLTEINAHKVIKERLGKDMRPYKILGACNPPFAHRAITEEPDIGLLMPCNVLVREEEDHSITVAFMDPVSVLGLVGRSELEEIAQEVRNRLFRVRDALTSSN
jgi:uncharacterized protein (DUF302 family)